MGERSTAQYFQGKEIEYGARLPTRAVSERSLKQENTLATN